MCDCSLVPLLDLVTNQSLRAGRLLVCLFCCLGLCAASRRPLAWPTLKPPCAPRLAVEESLRTSRAVTRPRTPHTPHTPHNPHTRYTPHCPTALTARRLSPCKSRQGLMKGSPRICATNPQQPNTQQPDHRLLPPLEPSSHRVHGVQLNAIRPL